MDPKWQERPKQWEYVLVICYLDGRSIIFRFLDALYYSVDGNFQQNQRDKPMDANDFPLTTGAAYFAHEDDFRRHQTTLGPLRPDVSVAFWLSLGF